MARRPVPRPQGLTRRDRSAAELRRPVGSKCPVRQVVHRRPALRACSPITTQARPLWPGAVVTQTGHRCRSIDSSNARQLRLSSTRARASLPGSRCCRATSFLRHTKQHPPRRPVHRRRPDDQRADVRATGADREVPVQRRRLRRGDTPGRFYCCRVGRWARYQCELALFPTAPLRTGRDRFRSSRLSSDYSVVVAVGCLLWIVSWQAAQTTRVLRRFFAMSSAQGDRGVPGLPRWASLPTW
jgi:hypothetical protein